MAMSAVRRKSNSAGCHLGGCAWPPTGLGHDEQHTIAVATTAMCCSDRSPTIDRDEQYVTATAAAVGYC
jgi:hypothetical protein